jgi:hypothetical protein
LRRADQSSKESYRLCKKIYKLKYEARAQERAVEPLEKKILSAEVSKVCASQGNDTLVVSDHLRRMVFDCSKFNPVLNEASLQEDIHGLEV